MVGRQGGQGTIPEGVMTRELSSPGRAKSKGKCPGRGQGRVVQTGRALQAEQTPQRKGGVRSGLGKVEGVVGKLGVGQSLYTRKRH